MKKILSAIMLLMLGTASFVVFEYFMQGNAYAVSSEAQLASVEIGFTEFSPLGEAGGYAIPASGCGDTSHGAEHDCDPVCPAPEIESTCSYDGKGSPTSCSCSSGYSPDGSGDVFSCCVPDVVYTQSSYAVPYTQSSYVGAYSQSSYYSQNSYSSVADTIYFIMVDSEAHEDEAGNTAAFRVARNASDPASLDVALSFGGSAVRGTDYELLGGGIQGPGDGTATIPSNATESGVITLTAINDDDYEGTETVRPSFRLTPAGYSIGSPSTLTITIDESDVEPPPLVAPEISADNELIRMGETVTISWQPNGNTNCTLSGNLMNMSPAPNPNADGSKEDQPTGRVTYTITCEGGTDSVEVRVLPVIQET